MTLDQLIPAEALVDAAALPAVEIASLAYDSRSARPGALFFCVSGFQRDGHDFAPEALRNGAAALVVERRLQLGVPEALVDSARGAMAPAAARFYGDPSASLRVLGVTGTNGKTTTAFMVRELLQAGGERCGLLGTVKSVIGGRELPVTRTTPEAIDLQGDLRAMLDGGERSCAMEVSSHALELGRTEGIRFEAAIFTNLTQDHLDFHASMEDYFQAKRKLFAPDAQPPPRHSIINVADPYGRRLALELDEPVTFAVQAPEQSEPAVRSADYRASEVRCGLGGCTFTLHSPEGSRELTLPMPGRFNVANALGSYAAARALGLEDEPLLGALAAGVRVPGRFEPVAEGQDFAVLVDYAHTPDSLENALRAARELIDAVRPRRGGPGRVLCVFGAGGDRDRGKRSLMGEIAARLCEEVIVTSDNPRSEEPEAIIAEILAGADAALRPPRASAVRSEPDRARAIAQATALARAGDVLVIAGKGHEQGQELAGGRKIPFDDVAVARQALRPAGVPAGAR
jgi:UDP-N-acetylmuramoyl-L-alanyl-D-glutamate--2,6-diaminopimelate ligase